MKESDERERVAAIVDHPAVDLSRQQVFAHLETLREKEALSRRQNPVDGRGVVWVDDELHRVGEYGDVELDAVDVEDLDDDEVRQVARTTTYTWDLTNSTTDTHRLRPNSTGPGRPLGSKAETEGDPPPERVD